MAVTKAGDVETVDRRGKGRSRVPHGNSRIIPTTKSVDNDTVVSAVQNLPVIRLSGSIYDGL